MKRSHFLISKFFMRSSKSIRLIISTMTIFIWSVKYCFSSRMTRDDHDIFLMTKSECKLALIFCRYLMTSNWLIVSTCSTFTSLTRIAYVWTRIVVDSIILRIVSDFFCRTFLLCSKFVWIRRSSFSSWIIFRTSFALIFFMMFLISTVFKASFFASSTIKIVNSLVCFVVFELIDFSAIESFELSSRTNRIVFV